ncbi:phosphoribosylanthranilate isomerase [Candidatus Poribacteria bacterium]|nr:phosphoribosylanthranilate isomerase [Candidatus Poribacteria bacterium]
MTRIKICGITNLDDGLEAIAAGVDALGFVFVPNTPRYITPPQAKLVIKQLPPFITNVGLFVDSEIDEIEDIVNHCKLDAVQLHGNESPEMCSQISLQTKVIKSFHVKKELQVLRNEIENYRVDAYLLDTFIKGKAGGTGQTFDWRIAEGLSQRIILAGGLTPDNIGTAIAQLQPYGVDVSSGVEKSPGKKDTNKIYSFVRQVRKANLIIEKNAEIKL